jgi:hypothetical protein
VVAAALVAVGAPVAWFTLRSTRATKEETAAALEPVPEVV